MIRKPFISLALVAALASAHAERASADAFVGGLVGGFLGATIGSQVRTRPQRATGVSSVTREQNREVQTALNHFFFNVGTPDGVFGRQTRTGISQYQAYLGFPATGELTEFERQVLTTAYQRAVLGTPQVTQIAATHPNGLRGVLDTVRDEMLGVNRAPQAVVSAPVQPVAPAAVPAATVPNFFGGQGGGAAQVSLASHCNRVALVTSSNGGFTDMTTLSDPVFALNEQFCLARGYAIAEGEALTAQLPGVTPQAVAEQCAGLEPMLQTHVAALSVQPRDTVLAGVTQFVLGSGMTTADLAATARICLSSGYQTENLTVALGSALILVSLGESAYGELPAHHLMQGIGAAQRRELAAEWFRTSLPAGTATTEVSFRPGPDSRNALILAALDLATGAAPATRSVPTMLPMPSAPAAAAPVAPAAPATK